jgi:hypothetical protein
MMTPAANYTSSGIGSSRTLDVEQLSWENRLVQLRQVGDGADMASHTANMGFVTEQGKFNAKKYCAYSNFQIAR